MDLALLDPTALDRRWFDTHVLNRVVTRLAALYPEQATSAALTDACAELREQSAKFVDLLSEGQLDDAAHVSQKIESRREDLLKHLGTLLVDA
jgi:methyl-accepting chemotaxis protein